VIDPVPAVAPVNMTEQLPADDVKVPLLKEPPVVSAVRGKVLVPVGVFEGVVVSATVAAIDAVQLVAPRAMLQLTSGTEVVVVSFEVTVTVRVAAELVLPL